MRLKALFVLFPLALAGCFDSDPAHTEYFPEADGNRPDIFKIGFVQVCESRQNALGGAMRFARRYNMSQERISHPAKHIVAVYTSGLPMRAHLMVEHIYERRYGVSVSTFGGFPTDIVLAARSFDFCGVTGSPPNNSSKPTPLRGAA
ncbi:hypothetical protein [Lysobacter sp. HA18]